MSPRSRGRCHRKRASRLVESMTEVDPDNEATFHVCVIQSDSSEARVVHEAISAELQRCGFTEQATFAVKLALEEALVNAVKHGNECDCSKRITVRYAINSEKAAIIVRDEGCGFTPDEIPDPTTPDRLPLASGRGIMLMRAYMDEVAYRDSGREVYLMKRRA